MNWDEIRLTAIKALFSDDHLAELLVLKGGNAMSLIHGLGQRSSRDLDLSLEGDFEDLVQIADRIEIALTEQFRPAGFTVFDCRTRSRPSTPRDPRTWGGYETTFKIMPTTSPTTGLDERRRQATVVGPLQDRTMKIQISRNEYCGATVDVDVAGTVVTVYTPAMIAVEKLRAICQQMPEYTLNRTPTARARDFYDIYAICLESSVDLTSKANVELVSGSFAAKAVELELLSQISQQREFHRPDWSAVEDSTVGPLQDFDFYFDFVIGIAAQLETRLV